MIGVSVVVMDWDFRVAFGQLCPGTHVESSGVAPQALPLRRHLQCFASSPPCFVRAWVFSSEVRTVRRVRGCMGEGANRGLRHRAATEGAGLGASTGLGLKPPAGSCTSQPSHFRPVTIRALAVAQSSSDKIHLAKYHQTKYKVLVV